MANGRAAHAADRRRQILDAAVRVFARQGFHTCRVSDIADEAGVAYGLVYHYFQSKEQVLDTLFLERWDVLLKGIGEILQMAVLASVIGIGLSLPLGVLGARNLMPPWVTWPVRALVSLCRALHPVIVAILFVKAVGFGALAGILALWLLFLLLGLGDFYDG